MSCTRTRLYPMSSYSYVFKNDENRKQYADVEKWKQIVTDFIKLIFIALVISTPFAWVATSQWLQSYPYRIALSWWLFALAGLVVIAVALLTTSFQSVRTALTNPVKNLRSE